MFHQGGMSPMSALRSATIRGAKYIGMEDKIGTIETGKLADVIIIDGNPLENIQDTEHVTHTIMNGRIYDTATMNEIGNHTYERLPFYWERDGSGNAWPFNENNRSHMHSHCGCGY